MVEALKLNSINTQNLRLERFKKIHDNAFIDVTKELTNPPIALGIGVKNYGQNIEPISFGTFGNFSCIIGASKSKKTFIKSLLVASFIGGNSNNYAPDFKTYRKKDMFILDFDTEQGKYHSQKSFKRVMKLVGTNNYEYYKPFYLRKYDYKERLQFIEWCILESEYKNNIGFVTIDGLADLVNDVNDLESCNNLVQKLLKWTELSKCHLLGILHTNFGTGKPTGHLGSAILKKSETVCQLTKDTNDAKFTDVSFPYTRGYPIEDFKFSIDSFGLPNISSEKPF